MNYRPFFAFICAFTLMLGCGKPDTPVAPKANTPPQENTPTVVVTNYPLQFMAEHIAGGDVDIQYPVPANRDPAYWKPSEEAIALMQQVDLVLLNGAEHEKWLDTVTLDEGKLVDTSKSFADQYVVVENAIVHSHGPEGTHSHDGTAYSVWLDPALALKQAEAIAAALSKLRPSHAEGFAQRLNELKAQLSELGAILDTFDAAYRQQPVLASHPVYQYLERRCGLNLKNMHWEPYEHPDAGEWEVLDALLAEHPAQWMLWEGDPTPETHKALAERGIGVIVIDICGNTPDEGDFLSVMRGNFEGLLRINAPQAATGDALN